MIAISCIRKLRGKEVNSLPQSHSYEVEKPGRELRQSGSPLPRINAIIAKPVT